MQLAEFYLELGMYSQAIYSLEEVLLIIPNAYNVHARLGEVNAVYAADGGGNQELARLEASVKWYCRSVELCDGYLRGWYGLKWVSY